MHMEKLYDKHAIWIRLGFDPSTPEFEPQPNRMSHLGQQNVNSFFKVVATIQYNSFGIL